MLTGDWEGRGAGVSCKVIREGFPDIRCLLSRDLKGWSEPSSHLEKPTRVLLY